VWVEFNDVEVDGTVVTAVDLIQPGRGQLAVGETVVAGDDEGNRCPATVVGIDGWRLVLRLDGTTETPDGR
jgi:hypothetical protein